MTKQLYRAGYVNEIDIEQTKNFPETSRFSKEFEMAARLNSTDEGVKLRNLVKTLQEELISQESNYLETLDHIHEELMNLPTQGNFSGRFITDLDWELNLRVDKVFDKNIDSHTYKAKVKDIMPNSGFMGYPIELRRGGCIKAYGFTDSDITAEHIMKSSGRNYKILYKIDFPEEKIITDFSKLKAEGKTITYNGHPLKGLAVSFPACQVYIQKEFSEENEIALLTDLDPKNPILDVQVLIKKS